MNMKWTTHLSLCISAIFMNRRKPEKLLGREWLFTSCHIAYSFTCIFLIFFFSLLLQRGQSQHWRKTLKEFTGSPNMSSKPLLEYFAPLFKWLQADNKKHGEFIGWQGENDFCNWFQTNLKQDFHSYYYLFIVLWH